MARSAFAIDILTVFWTLSFLVSSASGMTLAAAFGHRTWRNTTSAAATSPFESGNIAAQATTTLDTGCVSGCYLPESEDRRHRAVTNSRNAPTATPTVAVTMTTGSPILTPMQHLAGRVLCLEEANRTAQATSGIAQPYHSVKSFDKTPPELVVAFTNPPLNNSLPNVSIHPTLRVNESKLSPNATCLDFVLNDCTNVHILIWPVLADASITLSEPQPRSLASEITTILSYVEICGLLAIILEIGIFVHAKVYKRWSKRWNKQSRAPTQEREGLR